MKDQESRKKWWAFLILTIGAGIIYKVPYFKTVYYDSLITAFGLTNTQLGSVMGIYAMTKTIIYIPGGILSDRFDNRKMLSISMVALALLTFWYAAIPGLATLKLIHVLFAFTNVVYWVSFVKAIRLLGSDNEQGSMFGYSEGIRALAGTAITFAGLWVLDKFLARNNAVSYALIFYGIVYFILGVLIWFVFPKETAKNADAKNVTLKDYFDVLKVPGVWLVALLVFSAYSVQVVSEYTTPYLTKIFGMTAVTAGLIATVRSYVVGVFSAPVAGKVADKVGSPIKVVCALFILEIGICFGLFLVPGQASMLKLAITTVLTFSVIMYGLRGIYYATMNEAKVPVALTGTATGIISVLGYLPDTFINTLMGSFLDKYKGIQGFKYGFLLMIGFAVLGLCVALVILFISKKGSKKIETVETK